MMSYIFYSIRNAYRFSTSQKNQTENRFHIPVRAVNRVPVHTTRKLLVDFIGNRVLCYSAQKMLPRATTIGEMLK